MCKGTAMQPKSAQVFFPGAKVRVTKPKNWEKILLGKIGTLDTFTSDGLSAYVQMDGDREEWILDLDELELVK